MPFPSQEPRPETAKRPGQFRIRPIGSFPEEEGQEKARSRFATEEMAPEMVEGESREQSPLWKRRRGKLARGIFPLSPPVGRRRATPAVAVPWFPFCGFRFSSSEAGSSSAPGLTEGHPLRFRPFFAGSGGAAQRSMEAEPILGAFAGFWASPLWASGF